MNMKNNDVLYLDIYADGESKRRNCTFGGKHDEWIESVRQMISFINKIVEWGYDIKKTTFTSNMTIYIKSLGEDHILRQFFRSTL